MAKQFIYPAINPIWMNPVTTFNPIYNNLPFDFQQPQKPYTQKAKRGLPQTLQVLSDWVPTLKIYNADNCILVDTIAPSTPTNGIVGQTFTVYEFTINWVNYSSGFYYIEISYNQNGGTATTSYELNEALTPDFIDGNLQIKNDGNVVKELFSNDAGTIELNVGDSYSFEGFCSEVSGAPNPRIRVTVKKNGSTIFDSAEVQDGANSIIYSGIVQPESTYSAVVKTEDTTNTVTPINISDNDPVDPDEQIWRSGLIQTADNFPQTVVVQYTNSNNAFSAVFSTGIVFALVVEGNIEDYTPAFEDVIYNDQEYNATKLNSIPHREFTFYVGSNRGFAGVPPWVADKLNWAFSCDQIQIDGQYYQNTNGSKWEVTRADQLAPNFIGLKIQIIEVINRYLQSYQPGEAPANSIQVITRTKTYTAVSSDITMAGIFKDFSLLTRIIIYNLSGDIFTLTAGTAIDGSEPITTAFTTDGRLKEVWEISELFDGVSTLYIQGLTGTNCNIVVEYDQLDAPNVVPLPTPKPFVKGTRYSYEEITVGDFENDWNVGTGIGNVGTKYEGCVLSGTNGTKDMNGLIEKGWNSTLPLTRDILVGNVDNLITQAENQIAAHRHLMFNADKNGGNLVGASSVNHENDVDTKRDYIMKTTNTTPTMGLTGYVNPSGAQPMDISNRARITVFFVCITD